MECFKNFNGVKMYKYLFIKILLICIVAKLLNASEITEIDSDNSFQNVVMWWTPDAEGDKPIPLYAKKLSVQNKNFAFTNPTYIETKEKSLIVLDFNVIDKISNIEVSVYNSNQKFISKFELPWIFDLPLPLFLPIKNNSEIVCISPDNSIKRFSLNGKILSTAKILRNFKYNSENVINVSPLHNEQGFFVSLTQPNDATDSPNKYDSYLFIADLNGNIILSKEYGDWQINSINTSDDGNILTVAMHSPNYESNEILFKSLVLDNQLNELFEIPEQHFKSIISFKNSKVLFINKHKSFLCDYANKKTINSFELKSQQNINVTGIELPTLDQFALLESKVMRESGNLVTPWSYSDPVLKIIDTNTATQTITKSFNDIKFYNPSLNINKTNTVFMGHSTGWKILKII